jgi:hypothetical protein
MLAAAQFRIRATARRNCSFFGNFLSAIFAPNPGLKASVEDPRRFSVMSVFGSKADIRKRGGNVRS